METDELGGTVSKNYYVNVRDGTILTNLYEKLDEVRKANVKGAFGFTKKMVKINDTTEVPFLIIGGGGETGNEEISLV